MKYKLRNNTIFFDFCYVDNPAHIYSSDFETKIISVDSIDELKQSVCNKAAWEGNEFNCYIKKINVGDDNENYLSKVEFNKPKITTDYWLCNVTIIPDYSIDFADEAAAKKAHRDLWQWLADNPNKNEWEWPKWSQYGFTVDESILSKPEATDILCQYVELTNLPEPDNEICWGCPMGSHMGCYKEESLYLKWLNCSDIDKLSEIALLIKNIWEQETNK